MYACMAMHSHVRTRTHPVHTHKKAKFTAAVPQLLPPSDNTGMPGTTQKLGSSTVNSPGAGLVTHRRIVQVSQIEVVEPKAPQ